MTKRILVVEDQPCHHSLESRHRPRRAELSISLICSLAMFTAIRRASSRVSGIAAARGSSCWPSWSRTANHVSCSSTVQGGGKRRGITDTQHKRWAKIGS